MAETETERERNYWHWIEMAHKHHVGTDGTCHPRHHPLCASCNPHILEKGPKPWTPMPITAPTAEALEKITTATTAGHVEALAGRVVGITSHRAERLICLAESVAQGCLAMRADGTYVAAPTFDGGYQ